MRAVLDTNVIVSAVLTQGSPPDQVIQVLRQGAFELITSEILLAELERVLRRPYFRDRLGWTDLEISTFISGIEQEALVVSPTVQLNVVLIDIDDNRVLEAAIAGQADYIVSGDRDLLTLDSYKGIEIVTPATFISILREASSR
jgi:uncharacterized protein